jgi:hypothetical protein
MKTVIAASVIVIVLVAAAPAPVWALEVSTRPGDSILGGSAGLSAVRLDSNDERIQSVGVALRGAHFVSERWALGAGLFLDRTDHDSTDITTGRILAELLLVPIPDANVSPFLRVGGGASRWRWETEGAPTSELDALTAEAAVGFFAFINEYFAVAIDATYFYDQYENNPDNADDHNLTATIGFVGFLR